MADGNYSAIGGFWALPVAVQSPDEPTLAMVPLAAGQARLSWDPNTPGFVL